MKIHTLVIPDIHGRKFWKDALDILKNEKEYESIPIVFLGDYVDPYDFEHITRKDAISNFKEIIEVAKNNKNVHLLIGNHDMHYWYDAEYKSRVDRRNYNEIKLMFLNNFELFNIAYEETINNEKYLYTHAGVTSTWLNHLKFIGKLTVENNKEYRTDLNGNKIKKVPDDRVPFAKMLKNMTPDAHKLNKMKSNFQGQANLWMASYARGGDYNCGSCIWEDLSEWYWKGVEIPGMWQIFGHSRWSKADPNDAYIDIERKFACVDTGSAWAIYDNGEIQKYNNE